MGIQVFTIPAVTLSALSRAVSDFTGYSQPIASGLIKKPSSAVIGCLSVVFYGKRQVTSEPPLGHRQEIRPTELTLKNQKKSVTEYLKQD
ncbi:hypothetical protein [Endozoicomonas sp. 2B-B]